MRLIGFRRDHKTYVGALLADDTVVELDEVSQFWDDPFAATARLSEQGETSLSLRDVVVVPPVTPSARVLCVGLNYAAHIDEGPFDAPEYPTIFGRWTASLAVSGSPVAVPPDEAGLDWEGELVAIVGRPLWCAGAEEASRSVFAYAAFNDITARRAQKLTTQWTIGKNADNSGPLSALITADEVGDPRQGWRIVTTVNGAMVQDAKTDQMVFSVGEVLGFLSRTFRLHPGDLVATGTPNGVGYTRTPPWLLHPGDLVEVDVENIGTVQTPVVAAIAPLASRP